MDAVVSLTPSYIMYFPTASDELKLTAIKRESQAILLIPHPTEEMLLLAVSTHPYVFNSLFERGQPMSEAVEDAAIHKNPNIIRLVPNPSEKQQVDAVSQLATLISEYKNPCEAAQLEAVAKLKENSPHYLRRIQGEHYVDVINAAIRYNARGIVSIFEDLPPESQRIAMQVDPRVYHIIKNYPSFDESLTKIFNQYVKSKNREHALPTLGRRSGYSAMNQDQLKILRWFELNNRTSISVKELKSLPWGTNQYFVDLAKILHGRDITVEDVKNDIRQTVPDLVNTITDKCKISLEKWNGQQRLFQDRQNFSAVFSLTGEELKSLLTIDSKAEELMAHVNANGLHPVKTTTSYSKLQYGLRGIQFPTIGEPIKMKPDDDYTVGWVRFTMFGKNVWIDEVQSDLSKIIKTTELKNINEALLLTFIRKMRHRGAEKFFMPTPDIRNGKGYYPNGFGVNPETNEPLKAPPAATYDSLPKKMRFKKEIINGLDRSVDGETAWVLEGRQMPSIIS